jgi:hypothetical protein
MPGVIAVQTISLLLQAEGKAVAMTAAGLSSLTILTGG